MASYYRASGLALLLGAALFFIATLLGGAYQGNDPHQYLTAPWVVGTLVFLLGQFFSLLGLPAIAVRQAARASGLGLVGFALAFLGAFLLTSGTILNLLVLPWLAQVAPQRLAAGLATGSMPWPAAVYFPVAATVAALGQLLLGIVILSAGILPRFAGLFLIISVVIQSVAISLFLSRIISPSGIISTIVGIAANGFLALGWVGYALCSVKGEPIGQTALTS